MSEYQCYEFVTLDRPLSAKQMSELRAVSTRAEISPTRFWNEYQWGDLRADPARLLERYFDAHLYFANWGTHRLMLRLPTARVNVKSLAPYFGDAQAAQLTARRDHIVVDLSSDREDDHYSERPGSLATLGLLRAELLRNDLRSAYLAWLLAVQEEEIEDDAPEPPVPPGLADLTAAQNAMIGFLRIDVDLVAAAASGSEPTTVDREPLRRWLAALTASEKDSWLLRAAEEPELAIGHELLRAFRDRTKSDPAPSGRSVGELRELAEARRSKREEAAAARAKRAKSAAEAARQRHLKQLARNVDGAWDELTRLVETSRYEEAVTLAVDLRDLAARADEQVAFAKRFGALRKSLVRRRGFFKRWKLAEGRA